MMRCLGHKVEWCHWQFHCAVNPLAVLEIEWVKLSDLLRKVGDIQNLMKLNYA